MPQRRHRDLRGRRRGARRPRDPWAVTAERSLLATLEAGCSAPVGALAEVVEGEDGEELWLRAVVLSLDGAVDVRRSASGPVDPADRLGRGLAEEMLAEGVAELMRPPSPVPRAASDP